MAAALACGAAFGGGKPDLDGVFGDARTLGIAAISSRVPLRDFAKVTNRLARAGQKRRLRIRYPARRRSKDDACKEHHAKNDVHSITRDKGMWEGEKKEGGQSLLPVSQPFPASAES